MTRFMPLVACVLTAALLGVPARADDPPKTLTAAERAALNARGEELSLAGAKAYREGKPERAEQAWAEALRIARRVYSTDEYPDGHPNLAGSLNNLAFLHHEQKKYGAAEPLYKEALDISKRFHAGDHPDVARGLRHLGELYFDQGKFAAAEPLYREALGVCKRFHAGDHPDVARALDELETLYREQRKWTDAEGFARAALDVYQRLYKGDHPKVARALNVLGYIKHNQGNLAGAEPYFLDSLAMRKRLFKGAHPDVANALNNLSALYQDQGKLATAEPVLKTALEMFERVYDGDHPTVATVRSNLGMLYARQDRPALAEPLLRASLDMNKRLFNGDHPDVARGLDLLGDLYYNQARLADAEPLLNAALAMRRRLHPNDHPDVASSLIGQGQLARDRGKLDAAAALCRDALDMRKRLFPGDSPKVAVALSNLASVQAHRGKYAEAEVLDRDALEMSHRMTVAYAQQKGEGESLTLIGTQPRYLDGLLSVARARAADPATGYDPATAYPAVWASKGAVARVFENRQLQARAATDPVLAATFARLADARRRRAELLLARPTTDPGTLKQRDTDLKAFEGTVAALTADLSRRLPAAARFDASGAATHAQLQRALPPDAAVVDFVTYTFFEYDPDRPVGAKVQKSWRYMAFVITRDAVAWADLDTFANTEAAVRAWRAAVTSGADVPADLPAKVRELVWGKVRKELPAAVKTVYVCPDAVLCRVPFGALPGDKPGTILLEDFAVATIPHAPFLLDKLWKADPVKNPPTGALVVGGVQYDADPAAPAPAAVASRRGDPLLKPGAKLGWSFLPGTAAEATGVFGAATAKKLPVTALKGEQATAPAVLAALPKARYAHFATHGFFADPSFRGLFQLDEKDYEMRGGERVGRAVNSPLVMTGLVFAGANNPKAPGRGIVTGESLIDLDLSGLELAVLSACETGLGDVAGGEGTFGLQRAFHYAGTRDVVASLWKVPDQSTAALMALFYRNLWDKNLPPIEALRQAQLALYRDPGAIPELAKGFRGKFEEVQGAGGAAALKPGKDGKAHPLLWAAFTLSGPGR